jgi:AcrR family transcriptional regulator
MASNDTYHHGNLRRELMDGALAVIRDRGLDALSLREVAAAAGVSHAAPYHHFADKGALVRALGYEGLLRLDERMAEAEAAAGDLAGERLVAIGLAYVAFAVERPEYFAAMRSPEMRETSGDEPQPEHGETWERLLRAVVACQAIGALPPEDPMVLAIGMWSLVHGLADLWLTAPISLTPPGAGGVAPLAEQVLRSMLTMFAGKD